MKPGERPENPSFSSGPCAKRPGWNLAALENACLGRSHRSTEGKARLTEVIERSKNLLGLPADYLVGIVGGSDTAAVEMALWNLLGARGVDVFAWESFSRGWADEIINQLGLEDTRVFEADYGSLPDLAQADPSRDVVFTWNGTTSGVRVPDGDWIAEDREGLSICDATSAVFAMELPWDRLDVTTYSWQKVLGGEAQHGIIILSPRAIERLESYQPDRPLPKLFRLKKNGKLISGIFEGSTINTPSLLCVEDALDGLKWVDSIGGARGLAARSEKNLAAVSAWVERSEWVDFLAADPATRSCTSICLKIVDPWFAAQSVEEQNAIEKRLVAMLAEEGAARDIGSYAAAPPGLRVWGGGTVETSDLEALFPWLDWAFEETRNHPPA
ncbi:MAG: phosphoserine transaminase [Planctomycetota bacterium]|nr:phosphoserine transaminase [Planctomycetota bacterium]MEC9350444.1 phosphoserine transaminase [Planctomycetota bacterium]